MTWMYDGQVFNPTEEELNDYIGFVYVITERETNMKYVGKKLFYRKKILPVTKTRKRRKHTLVESDWRKYYGSNEQVKENVQKSGEDAYEREILRLCKSRGECSYYEAKEQFDRDVLLRDDYFNGIINCRINRKHLSITK